MEHWGSGIPRIIRRCKELGLEEPELMEIAGSFRVKMGFLLRICWSIESGRYNMSFSGHGTKEKGADGKNGSPFSWTGFRSGQPV